MHMFLEIWVPVSVKSLEPKQSFAAGQHFPFSSCASSIQKENKESLNVTARDQTEFWNEYSVYLLNQTSPVLIKPVIKGSLFIA